MEKRKMFYLTSYLFFLCYFVNGHKLKNNSFINNEKKLYKYLMDEYDMYVRPVVHEKDEVKLQFEMALVSIDDLDERAQALHTNAWLRYSWKDVQLTWDPKEFGGLKSIRLPTKQLWTPDIVLYNNYRESYDVTFQSLSVVDNEGKVLWIPPMHLSSACPVDLQKFPFDEQKCILKFGSWTYHGNLLNLTLFPGRNKVDTNYFAGHTQFDIVDTNAIREVVKYECCPESYIDIKYTLTLKRKVTYATHMFMAPSVVLGLILPAIFLLPPESKEKMSFGFGLLFTNAMILTMLASLVPTAHATIPAVGKYHMANMVLIGLSLGISALVLNIWSKGDRGKKLPGFVQSYILGLLGRILCVPRDEFMQLNNNPPSTMRNLEMLSDKSESQGPIELEDDREDILRNFAQSSQRAEWRQLAVILDRLMFIVYLILVVITTLALATR